MTREHQTSLCLALLAAVGLAAAPINAQTFFAQPQSHLGRLVQSITSPLILSAAGQDLSAAEEAGDLGQPPSGSGGASAASNYAQQQPTADDSAHYQSYEQQHQHQHQQHHQAPVSHYQVPSYGGDSMLHAQSLQQTPSRQRKAPLRHYDNDDEDDAEPGYGPPASDDPVAAAAAAASNKRKQQQYASGGGNPMATAGANNQEYQMGAYLGPTIDDKEIQGAFNSNSNDERDDDDGPAGYEGPPSVGRPRGGAADGAPPMSHLQGASVGYAARGRAPQAGYAGPSRGPRDGPAEGYHFSPGAGESADDESDDSPPRATLGAGQRGSLNQAASQYHRQRQPRARTDRQLATAANGYAPYGPIDLSGLMAGQQAGAYELYNGDGSSYGFGPNYARGANGRRQQAASMSNQFGYGPFGYGPAQQMQQQQQQQQNNRGGDEDADADAGEGKIQDT